MESDTSIFTIIISAIVGAVAGSVVALLMQGRTRWLETQTYALSIVREMLLITRKLDKYETALKNLHKDSDRKVPSIPLTDDDLLIYRSNTGKIGLLIKPFALSTLKFYQQVRDLRSLSEKEWDNTEIQRFDPVRPKVEKKWDQKLADHVQEVKKVSDYGKNLFGMMETYTSWSYLKYILYPGVIRIFLRFPRLIDIIPFIRPYIEQRLQLDENDSAENSTP